MIATTGFFMWFYEGMGGIGGWLIFTIISFISVLYIFVSSSSRKMPALVFRLSGILLFLLVVPAIIYRFVPAETQATLEQHKELFFYLGLIGGIVPLFVALGYILRFQGMVVCMHGHVYDAKLGECPECIANLVPPDISGHQDFETELFSQQDKDKNVFKPNPSAGPRTDNDFGSEFDTDTGGSAMPYEPETDTDGRGMPQDFETEAGSFPRSYNDSEGATGLDQGAREFVDTQYGQVGLPLRAVNKKKAQAFLLLPDNHTYQLNSGTNSIGRNSDNDFVFVNEYVSRHHAKIVEEGPNLFRLHDLASANGTYVNGKKLIKSILLETDDEIRFGNEAVVLFLSSSKR